MIYAGGNDGMLHAFNGGFYDRTLRKFWKAYNPTATPRYSDGSGSDLGAERWAYIPYNLLPHLYWLTEPSYNQNVHVAYVDLKPRVFDAKIFADDTTHPGGWGTVLVGGMRFGGGTIRADLDKTDGLAYRADVDRTMTSAFFIFDITDAEAKPTLLAEVSSSDMGFTTCYPTVITMKDLDPSQDSNVWYLVLGSGPIGTHGADSTALADGTSNRSAKIVLLNLKELATNHEIWTLDGSSVPQRGIAVYSDLSGDANSFVSDPVSVDFDLDYRTDAVYFGTVSGDYASATGWGGKLRRIVLDDDTNPANWSGDSTLIDLTDVYSGVGQPIVAAPSIGMDGDGQRWLFVGTGRFFNRQDASHATASHQQSYYGLKEPYTVDGAGTKTFTWATVNRANLLDVTDATVFEGGTVQNMAGVTDFNGLKAAIDARDGWFLDFGGAKERNLGQAALLGNILTFTTYLPSIDPCQIEGTSNFYALYYGTGSAYTKSVIGLGSTQITENGKTKHEVLKVTNLGQGLTISPNIHTGREQGSKAYVQTSTGTILEIEEHNPGMTKSGKTSWEEWRE
jgi:type IV pilus assembly protein PilY1